MITLLTLARLIMPLVVFISPIFGIFLGFGMDMLDWEIVHTFPTFDMAFYQQWDKCMDIYLSTILVYYAITRWENKTLRIIALILYIYRLVGVLIFELSDNRFFLFLFPDLFDNFFIFMEVYKRLLKRGFIHLSTGPIATIVLLLSIPKLVQEYFLHVGQSLPWQWDMMQGITQGNSWFLLINKVLWGVIYIMIPFSFLYFERKKHALKPK